MIGIPIQINKTHFAREQIEPRTTVYYRDNVPDGKAIVGTIYSARENKLEVRELHPRIGV